MADISILLATPRADIYERALRPKLPDGARLSAVRSLADYSASPCQPEIIIGSPQLVANLLPGLSQLRWVQSSWAGIRPLVDQPRRGFVVTGISDIFGPQIAEYVAAHLLANSQRLDERKNAQRRRIWFDKPSSGLFGKKMLVLGTGSIGSDLAKRLGVAFSMRVVGLNTDGRATDGFVRCIDSASLIDELTKTDVVVNTLPDTPSTNLVLNRNALSALPDSATVINVGRANAVDMLALCDLLTRKKIAAAIVDVFDEEPVPSESSYWQTPNLTMTSHVAALTQPDAIVKLFLDNLQRYQSGQAMKAIIDLDRGY